DVSLVVNTSSATFYDETGHGYTFSEPSSCSFTAPPRIDATLAYTPGGYTLTKNASDVPAVTQWTQGDASTGCTKESQSLSRYPFVENDPVDNLDPIGPQIVPNDGWFVCYAARTMA